jgi:serine/threonine protein phosphatase PrpC
VYGVGAEVQAEIRRVNSTGGWVDDGRVCGVLAVSRAFGDWEFKGEGLKQLMIDGIEKGYWDEKLAAAAKFSSDPVVPTPDVTEIAIREEDELLIVATDGLWDYLPAGEACRWARKQFMAGMSPQEVADALTELAERRNTADNVGVVVVDLKGAAGWSSMTAKSSKTGGLFGGLFGKKG